MIAFGWMMATVTRVEGNNGRVEGQTFHRERLREFLKTRFTAAFAEGDFPRLWWCENLQLDQFNLTSRLTHGARLLLRVTLPELPKLSNKSFSSLASNLCQSYSASAFEDSLLRIQLLASIRWFECKQPFEASRKSTFDLFPLHERIIIVVIETVRRAFRSFKMLIKLSSSRTCRDGRWFQQRTQLER